MTVGRLLLMTLFIGVWSVTSAQVSLKKFRSNGKFGFRNAETGEVQIPAKFYQVKHFSEGLAPVCKKSGKGWFYINENGKTAIKSDYDNAEAFQNGLSKVRLGKHYGFIDLEGNEVVPVRFLKLNDFRNDVCKAFGTEGWVLINSKGLVLTQRGYTEMLQWEGNGLLKVIDNGLEGYLNEKGLEVIPCDFDKIGPFRDGWAKVRIGENYGFIDEMGQIIIPVAYTSIDRFDEKGMALAEKVNKFGFLNRVGEEVVPFEYDDLSPFIDNLAKARKGRKWGYVNRKGEETVTIKWDAIAKFTEGYAGVALNRKYGFVRKDGKLIVPAEYEEIRYFDEGRIGVKKSEDGHGYRYGYYDTLGKIVLPIKYEEIGRYQNGICYVRRGGLYGFVDINGRNITKIVYESLDYLDRKVPFHEVNRSYMFFENLAMVRRKGKYGFINKKGQTVVPFKYDFAWHFSEGLAKVEKDGKYGFINAKGQEVIPIQFTDFEIELKNEVTQEVKKDFYDATGYFQNGFAVVSRNNKMGIVNKAGKVVVPIRYDFVNNFSEGKALVRNNWEYGYVNQEGKVTVNVQFDNAISYSEGLAAIRKGNEWAFIDHEGNRVIDWELDYVLSPFQEVETPSGPQILSLVLFRGTTVYINKKMECVPVKPYGCP